MLPYLPPLNLSDAELSYRFSRPALALVDRRKSALSVSDEDTSFRTPLCTPPTDLAVTDPVPQPPPEASSLAGPTPCQEHPPDLATATFQRSLDLPESPVVAPLASVPKPMRNLRLPFFDALGIVSPISTVEATFGSPGVVASRSVLPSPTDDPLPVGNSSLFYPHANPQPAIADASPGATNSDNLLPGFKAVRNYVLTHTPPDDLGSLDWSASDAKMAAGTERVSSTPTPASAQEDSNSSIEAESSLGVRKQLSLSLSSERVPWLTDALGVILDIVHHHNQSEAIKILSHALPSPSINGHVFPVVIESIQRSMNSSSIMWMNVWHAVSGRFKFEDLPKSPPTTPAPPFEGEDYFTQRVFDYAVEVPDYSQNLTAKPLTASQQRPAIAPSSIDISIVERYIPPTSTAEFDELFSVFGRSFLSDRLIELSPSHGTLLFIYPTKAGGDTFKKDYLEPVLDPALRSMMISHGLPVTLVENIGQMGAIGRLPSFEDMKSELMTFLNTLNNTGTSPHSRFHRQGATYSLMYSQPQEVQVDRLVWAQDWWGKQEKLRIQRAFETHDVQGATMTRQAGTFQAAAHLATATRETHQAAQSDQAKLIQRAQTQSLLRDAERSRGERQPGDNEQLILRLLQQVATKEYKGGSPTKGIEVGVFVIQKTYAATVLGA